MRDFFYVHIPVMVSRSANCLNFNNRTIPICVFAESEDNAVELVSDQLRDAMPLLQDLGDEE